MKHISLDPPRRYLLVVGVVALLAGLALPALAQSVWKGPTGSTWDNPTNWSGPIPNAPGSRAAMTTSAQLIEVALPSEVILGQLQFVGQRTFKLGGSGPLTFDNPGDSPGLINFTGSASSQEILVPVHIVDSEGLSTSVTAQSALLFKGGLTPSSGDLTKLGAGTLELSIANTGWGGNLIGGDGTVWVRNVGGLGNTAGFTQINQSGTVNLLANGSYTERFVLNGGTLAKGTSFGDAQLNGPIELGALSNITSGSALVINGVVSGQAGIRFGGSISSFVILAGDNTYEGETTVEAGRVSVRSATALGSTAAGTIVKTNGELIFENNAAESITVRGGTVNMASSVTALGPITIENGDVSLPSNGTYTSPIVLAAPDAFATVSGRGASFTGGVTGEGDLVFDSQITVSGQPLAHNGKLITTGYTSSVVTLNSANTYTGTTVLEGGQIRVNHPLALGTSSEPIEIYEGWLELNEVVQRELRIGQGVLRNNRSDVALEEDIYIGRGAIRGLGVYNGDIHLLGDPQPARLISGTFNGEISGDGDVDFGYSQETGFGTEFATLNADNSYTGYTGITGRTDINTPGALGTADKGTIVDYTGVLNVNAVTTEKILVAPHGRVNLNVQLAELPRLAQGASQSLTSGLQTVAVNVPSAYHQHFDVNEGNLEINANTEIDSVEVRNGGLVDIKVGTLSTASEVHILKGGVNGALRNAPTIRKATNEFGHLGPLPGYNGQIIVEGGFLQVSQPTGLGTTAGATYVNGQHDAVLQLRGSMTVAEDIFLNNAQGADGTGGLRSLRALDQTAELHLNGRIDLGTEGSVIGAGDGVGVSNTSNVYLNGPVSGGSLTLRGSGLRLSVRGNANTYTGKTDVREGTLVLTGEGRLESTSQIVLYEDDESFKGRLLLDNRETNRFDRVADTIPIIMKGGALDKSSPINQHSAETLGPTTLAEGHSRIEEESSAPNYSAFDNDLTLASLSRERGATGQFSVGTTSKIYVQDAPQLLNGILPWLRVDLRTSSSSGVAGFGTVTANGIVPFTATKATLIGATAIDNVAISGGTMSGNQIINSLNVTNGTLNLAGNTLKLESGGLMNGNVSGGMITAGALSDHELFIHNGQVAASIIDNGENPVDVTITGGVNFTGVNSYSGTTYVNENSLYLGHEQSLPANTDLQIIGGELAIGYTATEVKHLGQIRLAGNGEVGRSGGTGNLSFEALILEDGDFLPGMISGNGAIYKGTTGKAAVGASGNTSTYAGHVYVEDGVLASSGLPQATYHVSGGRLTLPSGGNTIHLDGGALEALYHTGTIHVDADSRIVAIPRGNERNYGLAGSFVGSGKLTFENLTYSGDISIVDSMFAADTIAYIVGHSPNYSGDIDIKTSTVSLRYQDSLGMGDITVHSGGKLALSPLQGNFNNSGLDLANTIHLKGGEIYGFESVFRPQQLVGDIYVSGNSYISALHVPGNVYLTDGSRLAIREGFETRFLGDVYVGGTSEFLVTRTSNDASHDNNIIQLGGRIVSNSPQSVLKIFNSRLDQFVFDASFHVQAGHTLQILEGGLPKEIVLGAGSKVSGDGTFLNPVTIEGGVLNPGNSPGTLHFADSLAIGPGSIYEWEINDALGSAGGTSGWDLIDVTQDLTFAATSVNPLTIHITGLDASDLPGKVPNLDPLGSYRWLIASANNIFGFDPSAVEFAFPAGAPGNSTFRAPNFLVEVDGSGLYLAYEYRVPEPSTGHLWLSLGVSGFLRRRMHGRG